MNSRSSSALNHGVIGRTARIARRIAPALGLAFLAAGLGACESGHGKYTAEHIVLAKQKMAQLKSGTEWQMAHQQFLAGELDKALKSVDRSISLNPNVTKSHVLRGRILLEQGRLEDARQELLLAESLDPNYVDTQYFLAIVFERFSQPEQALERYLRATDLDAANPQYAIAAAEMMISKGELDQAENFLNSRRQHFEYNAALRQTLGHIAMLRGDSAKAALLFNDAMLLAPEDNRILEDLVHAQMASGQFADAEFNLNRVLEKDVNKGRRDLLQLRARCLTSLDRPVEARTILIELTSDTEGARDVRAWVDLGQVSLVLKDRVHLRLAASRVIAIAPDQADGYMLRALYCRMDDRPEDAIAALDLAAARSTTGAGPLLLKALILQDLGRVPDARAALAAAVKIDPKSQKARDLLAALGGAPTNLAGHPDAGD